MPIYVVENKQSAGVPVRVIEADNAAQVTRHVAADTFSIKTANSVEVARLMSAGAKLEDATKPQRELPIED